MRNSDETRDALKGLSGSISDLNKKISMAKNPSGEQSPITSQDQQANNDEKVTIPMIVKRLTVSGREGSSRNYYLISNTFWFNEVGTQIENPESIKHLDNLLKTQPNLVKKVKITSIPHGFADKIRQSLTGQ